MRDFLMEILVGVMLLAIGAGLIIGFIGAVLYPLPPM